MGERKEISIVILPQKKAELIQEQQAGGRAQTDRFQVIMTAIESGFYETVHQITDVKEQADKIQHFWESVDKQSILSRKFDVSI